MSLKKNLKMRSQSELFELLRGHGIAPTQQRIKIAQIFLTRPQHLAADQVMSLVSRDGGRISKATVYNTLKLFASKGLLREVIVDPVKVFYDSTVTPHHHIYNVDTGTLTDISIDALPLATVPAVPAGTVTEGIDVIIRVRNLATATG